MSKRIISPFDGKPLTEQFTDENGNTEFLITPQALTPLRVKLAEFLAGISVLGWMAAGLHALDVAHHPAGWLWGAAFFGPWLAYSLLDWFWRLFLYKKTRLVMTTDQFKFLSWKGWKSYDRKLPHKFALVLHDKTQAEKDAHNLEVQRGQARGKVVVPKRYYTDSYHLSFEYLGQRNDVMTVYGHKEALAILARLKACDEILDAEARMGEGTPLSPEDQWNDQPGGIE
jgi:hypothetical protein